MDSLLKLPSKRVVSVGDEPQVTWCRQSSDPPMYSAAGDQVFLSFLEKSLPAIKKYVEKNCIRPGAILNKD